ncbi:hypothetical protein [Nocardioides daeguensis]|uniref:Uncharacterized protein n=1 Tax=Nocardioides daeguensis TaxID=908359 RepID=A0ABP6WBL0_9ACTN|nr:hypothetical protein [Nocardioides daeguensis]MBV6729265.1 hypothetical protein [Nocardioides daeguensis]MCR1774241.1 hypothetical protein [Nocardioides daeguensis]
MNENQLATVLSRAGERLDPDVEALVAGAARRGRRKVRRRGAAVAVGGAVAGLVVGAVAWQGSLGATTAHDRTATRPTPPAPTPAWAGGLTPDNQRSLAPDDVVLERFVRHLPGGRISALRMTPIDDPDRVSQHGLEINLRIDGTDVEVRLYDMSSDAERWAEVARRLPGNKHCAASPACTARRTTYSAEKTCGAPECRPRPDGSWLWPRSGDGGDGSDRSGFTANWSGLFAPDGWMVDVSATNRDNAGEPLLSVDELTALATADLWFE